MLSISPTDSLMNGNTNVPHVMKENEEWWQPALLLNFSKLRRAPCTSISSVMRRIKVVDTYAETKKRSAPSSAVPKSSDSRLKRPKISDNRLPLIEEKKEALVAGHGMLTAEFFQRSSPEVARDLVGKVIRVFHAPEKIWLSARIIESEAYELTEKGSHSNAHGNTPAKRALFMSPGTIYMYYARGKDSFNCSCGNGNACLIKSGIPYVDDLSRDEADRMLEVMHRLNPATNGGRRKPDRLCSGQTLLCSSLGLKVTDWNQKTFDRNRFWLEDVGYRPTHLIQTTRLGIPKGRDEHLPYRWVDPMHTMHCTSNPNKKQKNTAQKQKKKTKKM